MSESALGGHLLGPVRLDVDGRPVEIGSRRTRLVAAALIARAGRITGIERLADIVWRGDPPRTWLVQLQTCVMELRRAIEAAGHPSPRDVLVTVGPGYRLRLSPGCLDVERFRAATAQARALADADPTEARRRYVAAEAMCAGRAFDDVRDFGLEAEARALDELLHAARLDRLALDLRCGAAAEAIVELRGLTEAFPWQERPHALLMTALWQERRGVEALEHFRRLRREWVRQLGIEPGGELVALQTRILLGDAAAEPVDQRVPHELPSPPSPLVGRDTEVAVVAAALAAPDRIAPAVICLHGPPGTGTTTVAVAAAHAAAETFGDGQVFLTLRRPDGTAEPTDELVAQVLRALGHTGPVPDGTERRTALLRTLTADRRVLIVADDAVGTAQVRAILPSGAGCAVLVTAIRPLLGLDRVQHVAVPPLSDPDARELLSALAGRALPDDESCAAVLDSCAGSPLALRIVGARLSVRPDSELAVAAHALARDDRRLDYLVAGDLAVRQGLRLSYGECGDAARHLLRTLAWLPTADAAAWLLAAALGVSDIGVASAAGELLDVGLLQVAAWQPVPRFALHALVRAFARELEPIEGAAVERMVIAAAYLARRGDAGLGHGMAAPPDGPEPDPAAVDAAVRTVEADGLAFFDAEAFTLTGLVRAGAAGRADANEVARLALAVNGYLTVRDRRTDREDVLRAAIGVPERLDPTLYARCLLALFAARAQAGAAGDELVELADRAVRAGEAAGDKPMAVAARRQLGFACRRAGRLEPALAAVTEALALCGDAVDLAGERASLRCTEGVLLRDLGRPADGLVALLWAAYQETDVADRRRAVILADTAEVALDAGETDVADRALSEAERIVVAIGDRLGQAYVGFVQARAAAVRGDNVAADARFAAAHEAFAGHEDPMTLRWVRLIGAELAARRGDTVAADRVVTEIVAEASEDADPVGVLRARQVRAVLATLG